MSYGRLGTYMGPYGREPYCLHVHCTNMAEDGFDYCRNHGGHLGSSPAHCCCGIEVSRDVVCIASQAGMGDINMSPCPLHVAPLTDKSVAFLRAVIAGDQHWDGLRYHVEDEHAANAILRLRGLLADVAADASGG